MKTITKTKRVIQIIEYSTENVVQEIDVTGRTDNAISKIDSGLNINLNHSEYYTIIKEL